MSCGRALAGIALLCALQAHGAEEFKFDASEFRRKAFEFSGYVEAKQQQFKLNPDGAFYLINFYDHPRNRLDQTTLTLKPSGKLRAGDSTLDFRAHLEGDWETRGFERNGRLDELFFSHKPTAGFTAELGKISKKWGKGYAWNPVGFIERIKDPNDPDLAREGFTMVAADIIRNFDGALQTVAFTPVLLPVSGDLNREFGASGHLNFAAKVYLLYRDTDIDFMFLSGGSRSRRYGADFSRNLTSNLEIHGEWARITDAPRPVLDADRSVSVLTGAATSYLLGLRYLTARDTTYIVEYYRNGPGFTEDEFSRFFDFVDSAYQQFLTTGNKTALERMAGLARAGYGRPNPGRNYLYLRASQKEPFDILYFTPAITLIANADDRSTSIVPEVLYTGITNVELRARAFFLNGGSGTDFGEKQNKRRIELQARLYF